MGSTAELDVNLIRLHPEILNNKTFLKYFVELNNCDNPTINQTVNNELDYPQVAQFYSGKSREILMGLPNYVDVAFAGGTRKLHDDSLSGDALILGDYDRSKGAFPLVHHAVIAGMCANCAPGANAPQNDNSSSVGTITLGSLFHKKNNSGDSGNTKSGQQHAVQLDGSFGLESNRDEMYKTCPAARDASTYDGHMSRWLPGTYNLKFSPIGFDELPMSEADARQYITTHPPNSRKVHFVLYLKLLNQAPELTEDNRLGPDDVRTATFSTQVAKVSVIDDKTGAVLGNLVDDHTISDVVVGSTSPKAAATQGPESAVFMSHLSPPVEGPRQFHYNILKQQHANYLQSIDVVVQVRMANDLCKWHLAGDQLHNVDALLRDAQGDPSGSKELAYKADFIQKGIDSFGPENYCRNMQMRSQYEQLLNSLWPVGRIANPDAFW